MPGFVGDVRLSVRLPFPGIGLGQRSVVLEPKAMSAVSQLPNL